MARSAAVALALVCLAGPALAQMQMVNPFAGRMGAMGPRNMAPYGSRAGAIPHVMQSTNGMMMSMRNSVAGMMNTLAEAVALAVFRAVEDRAEAFGTATDMEALKGELATLQDRYSELLVEVEGALTSDDMMIDFSAVSVRERDDGLAKVTIRGIPLTRGWPERLVASAA